MPRIEFPRKFEGRQLAEIAFPLGGIGTGSISLGGRGQLRDWEIFNRPDKGNSPTIVLPTFWVQQGHSKPIAKVLESRFLSPYSASAFWAGSMRGLPRFASAIFTGSFPLARIEFQDADIPVQVRLEAFSPFIPLDPDQSGLPVAILRYRVRNPGGTSVKVAIGYSIANPLLARADGARDFLWVRPNEGRINELRTAAGMQGLLMQNPALAASHHLAGTLALSALNTVPGKITSWRGWGTEWWSAPLQFWDDFAADGELGPEPTPRVPTGSLVACRDIPAHSEVDLTFLLSWHFPNRTPERCGYGPDFFGCFLSPAQVDKLREISNTVIGNHYCTRFPDAWAVAEYVAAHLPELERRTHAFEAALRESTLPGSVLDAASANLSTLVTNTCFRTADGTFHGFEGSSETVGSGPGSCTHVWNYEAAVPHLFPQLSRTLRDTAFGVCTDEQGLMDHREFLPAGIMRLGLAAADGQMGSIIKLYLDWRLSGDTAWLRRHWPAAKRALAFAWIAGGWDADRDGVMEGAQHNTYDVDFCGPNPLMGCFYLGALRAAEEMARVVDDRAAAEEYRRLFAKGSQWIDANLFNGEYYIQQVLGIPKAKIAPGISITPVLERLTGTPMPDPLAPVFQLGDACLADQLCGQYLAHLAGLGRLLDVSNIRKALQSIHRYNYRRCVDTVQNMDRSFAINDEAAIIVCSYGGAHRPKHAFFFADEVWTGTEYATAAMMIFEGFVEYGVEAVENVRRRHDGEKRNPWSEPEAGHHYARAMSAWGVLVALSGFNYHAGEKSVVARPRIRVERFKSFWSTGTGWGTYSQNATSAGVTARLSVLEGQLPCRTIALTGGAAKDTRVAIGARIIPHRVQRDGNDSTIVLGQEAILKAGETLEIAV